MRREVSIIIRNYFRKTWIRSNNIPILLVYSYLIEILIKSANLKFSEQRSRETEHNLIPTLFCHQVRARSVTNDTIRGSTDSTKTLMLSQVVTATQMSIASGAGTKSVNARTPGERFFSPREPPVVKRPSLLSRKGRFL